MISRRKITQALTALFDIAGCPSAGGPGPASHGDGIVEVSEFSVAASASCCSTYHDRSFDTAFRFGKVTLQSIDQAVLDKWEATLIHRAADRVPLARYSRDAVLARAKTDAKK